MRTPTLFILALACGWLAAGCTVGPDYKPPELAVPPQWSEAPATQPVTQPDDKAEVADLARWWISLGDPTLNGLVEQAIRSNLDLRIATARVRQARAELRGSRAGLYPQAEVTGGVSRGRQSQNLTDLNFPGLTPGTQNLYQAGFDANWEVDVFGGVRRSVEAAVADEQAVVEDRRNVLVTLIAEVARNYAELRGFQGQLAFAEKNIQTQRDSVDLTTARLNAGLIGELDVDQAQALLATTEAQVPALETSMRQTIHRLGVLLGREPGALLPELTREAPIPGGTPAIPAGLPSEMLRRRPDVRRAERQLAAATARIGVAVADLFPKFSLTGAAGLESISTSDFFTGGSRYLSIGPTLTWPVFTAGRVRANIAVSNALEEQARASYESAVLTSLEDVENALVAYAKEQRAAALSNAVDSNRRSVEIANELYGRGLTAFINVLQAQTSLYQSEDQLVQSRRAVTTDLIAIYKALGGGWEESGGVRPRRRERANDMRLTPEMVVQAYRLGIFPMATDRHGQIEWFSPDPRAIIPLDEFHVPRSLARRVRSGRFRVTFDLDFEQVIRACAEPRPGHPETWINDEIIGVYSELNRRGVAHSVEAWLLPEIGVADGPRLVGGLYGLALGGAFFGESMFTRATDASKVCMVHLIERLKTQGFVLLDTQMRNPHVDRFGAIDVSREAYLALLQQALRAPAQW